jgi:CubicO group peptidase (beta-lactamase class C family)
MSAAAAALELEQPFRDAIEAGKISGVVMEARSVSGGSYSGYIGTQTSPDGDTKPLSPSSLPYMASATKILVTLAALQLVERGKLSLDEDLRPSLPELTSLGVLIAFEADDGTGSGEPKMITTPLDRPLTLRQLLTHSSGMDYTFFNPLRAKYRAANPPPRPAATALERIAMPATCQPGSGWMYGHGPDVAAYLIERAGGLRLDEYLRTNVFAPVGAAPDEMSYFPVREGLGPRMPDLSPQDPEGFGLAAVGGFNAHDGGDVCYGGHGAYVTVRAFVAVLESVLNNDGRVLGHEMVREMFTPQLDGGMEAALQTALEGPAGPAFGCGTNGAGRNWGLGGLLVGEDDDGGLGKGAMIWGGGHNTVWVSWAGRVLPSPHSVRRRLADKVASS